MAARPNTTAYHEWQLCGTDFPGPGGRLLGRKLPVRSYFRIRPTAVNGDCQLTRRQIIALPKLGITDALVLK
jgi:hypothetical protein